MAHVHDLINYGSGDFDDNTTTKANIVLRCIRRFSKGSRDARNQKENKILKPRQRGLNWTCLMTL